MTVCAVREIKKLFGNKTILEGVSFTIGFGERAGLVGPNGAGKSTLLRILTGELVPDQGTVFIAPASSVGYLRQTLELRLHHTVQEILDEAVWEVRNLGCQLERLAAQMAVLEGAELENVLAEYGEKASRFEQKDGYQLEAAFTRVLTGLGLQDVGLDRQVHTLSGGQKTRLGLAALLLQAPDLLILDEPTNHLDHAALIWLEQYLAGISSAVLVVSHDREFLDRTVTKILELDEWTHRVQTYSGNFQAYSLQKQVERTVLAQKFEAQQAEIRQLQKRIQDAVQTSGGGRARGMTDNNKMAYNRHGASVEAAAARTIRAAEVQMERILAEAVPRPPQPLQFKPAFHAPTAHHRIVMTASNLAFNWPNGHRVLQCASLHVGERDRLLITGDNGTGKTTLLDILAGIRQPASGLVHVAPEVQIGYLRQEYDLQDANLSVTQLYGQHVPGTTEQHVAQLLSYCLFRYEELQLTLGELSPGQRRKLELAILMGQGANLLLVDEPTNHFGFEVVEELERALGQFPGAVIAVSHDRWFVERFAGSVYVLRDGILHPPVHRVLTEADEVKMVVEIQELAAYSVSPGDPLDVSQLLAVRERDGQAVE